MAQEYDIVDLGITVDGVMIGSFNGVAILDEDGPESWYVKSITIDGREGGFARLESDSWLFKAIADTLYADDTVDVIYYESQYE